MTQPSPPSNQTDSHPIADSKCEMKQTQDLDVGAAILNGTIHPVEVDSHEARKFLDKSCVSYAALWGMVEEAHLVNDQYSWLTTIFYLGYMAGEFPINMLFQKFDIAKTCGILIILWGATLLSMTAGHNFAGLATARLFLGILEAGVSPCFVLLTTMFYTRSEQPLRTSIWFSMNGVANILGGLIAYGIGHLHAALPAWKFPFIIFGSITIVWGIIFILVTPSNPTKAKWLSEREKEVAVLRVLENETGIDNKTFKMEQVKEALLDPRFWLINLHCLANTIPNVRPPFHLDPLSQAKGASQVLALWISGYLATRFKGIRHFLMIGGLLVALLGGVLIFALPESNRVGRLIGYYLLVGFSVNFVLSLTLLQSNVAGRTKKTMFASSFFVSYCVGNLIGPQLFFSREAPRYQSGFASMIVCFVVQIAIVIVMYTVNARENKRRDLLNPNGAEEQHATTISLGLSDITDVQNLHFRYVL
ncbi:unnamed protein product [Penicillium discolor]